MSLRPIIIGAGRGSRLNAMTEDQPKCYMPIGERRILDWTLEAFERAGIRPAAVFIGGYMINRIQRDYPGLTFCHNEDWENNNILASLMHGEAYMDEGFICSYSDILFHNEVIERAVEHEGDIVLCVDTHWRDRYTDRSEHPEDDAEKVIIDGDRVVEVRRDIASEDADGEYIGVARFNARGAAALCECYHRVHKQFGGGGGVWRGAAVFEKAYLILIFQEMIEQGVTIHCVTTPGLYMEIDTEQDYELACRDWPGKFEGATEAASKTGK